MIRELKGWHVLVMLLAFFGITIGVLGGFTTYSAFALETVTLAGEGAWPRAFAYLIATVVGCALLAQAGRVVGSLLTEI